MAQYASVKRRPKTEARPSPKTVAHNQRYNELKDLLPKELREPNWHDTVVSNATKTFKGWEAENEQRYQQINGRQLRSDAVRLESLAIILSAEQVAKCNPQDVWNKAQEFKKWFEGHYKTTVRTMDWHRDEGKILDNGKAEINEHVHLEFDNVNMDGKMVRRLFTNHDLVQFQDKVAEIYKPLGFVRGEDTAKKHRHDTPKRGTPQKQYKQEKKKEALGKLQDEVKTIRSELKEAKATRPDYALLEAENKRLKGEIETNKISAAEAIKELKALAFTGKTSIRKGTNPLTKKVMTKEVPETWKQRAEAAKTIEFDIADFNAQGEEIKTLKSENKKLRETIVLLNGIKTSGEKLACGLTIENNALKTINASKDTTIKRKDAQIASSKEKITTLEEIIKRWTSFIKGLGLDMFKDKPPEPKQKTEPRIESTLEYEAPSLKGFSHDR